ncbi:MAG: Rieske (2Fe-2S) protein [Rubrobacter sp.]|nr:Rieske (2Fe-2S) protein [Rubrobacter sp.]
MSQADREGVSRKGFLRIGAAAGLAATGAPILASCGKDLPKVKSGRAVIAEKKLKPNSAFVFADAKTEDPRVVVRLESGKILMYSAKCTHKGCTVGYKPEEQHLVCPCHNSIYSPLSGGVVSGPADKPLAKLPVKVANGKVLYT